MNVFEFLRECLNRLPRIDVAGRWADECAQLGEVVYQLVRMERFERIGTVVAVRHRNGSAAGRACGDDVAA